MGLEFNVYSVVLLTAGLFTLFISCLIFKKLDGTRRWFSLLTFLISLWAITYGFELSCLTLADMLFWINLEYIGIAFLPTAWISFIIHFTGKEKWLSWQALFLIFIIPVITVGMVWTNTEHHLHYTTVSIDKEHAFPLLNIKPGIWYRVFTVYFYFLLAWGGYLLIRTFKQADQIYKKQNRSILLGAFIPWIVNFLYHLGLRPQEHIDLTPFAFIATGLMISLGLLRYKLFDIIPIGREKVINAMHDGFLILDHNDRIVDFNENTLTFLEGIIPNPLIGTKLIQLFPNAKHLNQIVQDRINGNTEIEVNINNQSAFFDVSVTSLFQKNTIYSGVALIFRDITELKKDAIQLKIQSDQLSELNKLKDRVFTIISHDLRTPIHQLGDILNMTIKGMISEQELNLLMPELAKSVKQTASVLDNLLFWSKTQIQGKSPEAVILNLFNQAQAEIEFLTPRASEKNISIECQIENDLNAFSDKEMTRLILRNLINNAIKFCNPGDVITISAVNNKDNFAEICIKDTGTGIKPEILSKLFCSTTFSTPGTFNEQGSGLGLLLCKDFVEKNDGKIWAESIWQQGSKFYFTLPVASHLKGNGNKDSYKEKALDLLRPN
ncbi:histidine kinase N-terminal 7TM domain-containing protein [Solitalea lacus]|uniref:sensor histidine kinase n=1 Tax=Solitalea lacus TaxID=2911172 RepID=UPI001EDBE43C|nr:histidine kinase N-terminal 7TM domain-containing protein [Solitalea lacus]UKJ09374.1 ATP-binding protein [Solitalea lacus]